MSIFWFPEPVSCTNILIEYGYLKKQGLTQMAGGREFIEVPVPRRVIKVQAINIKKKEKEITVNTKLINI